MEKEGWVLAKRIVLVLVLLLVVFGVWRGVSIADANKKALNETGSASADTVVGSTGNNQQGGQKNQGLTRTDNQNGVDVTITWVKTVGSSLQKFQIEMGNHMYNLDDFDLAKNIGLKVDNTDAPAKVTVDGKSGEGHHVSADISVDSKLLGELKPGQKVTLTLTNLVNVPIRTFTWTN